MDLNILDISHCPNSVLYICNYIFLYLLLKVLVRCYVQDGSCSPVHGIGSIMLISGYFNRRVSYLPINVLFHLFHIIIYLNVSISLQWVVIPFSSTIRGTPLDSVKGNEHSTQVTVSCSTGRQPLFEGTFIYKYLPHLLTY